MIVICVLLYPPAPLWCNQAAERRLVISSMLQAEEHIWPYVIRILSKLNGLVICVIIDDPKIGSENLLPATIAFFLPTLARWRRD